MLMIHELTLSEHIDVITKEYKKDAPYWTKEAGEG